MSLDQLKIELKTWEHEFEGKHDRAPTKDDIKRLPDIKKMYKQYHMLKKQESKPPTATLTPSKNVSSSPRRSPKIANEPNGIELGPTPQIYGKAISIFEMKLSPVKRSLVFEEQSQVFLANSVSTDSEESDQEDVKRKLEFPMTTPNSSPFKRPKAIESKYYGPNSPMKLEQENIRLSIRHGSPLKRTPEKASNLLGENGSFSPSPLMKRPLTKTLLELAKEHEAIIQEFENIEDKSNIFFQDAEDSSSDTINDETYREDTNWKKPKRRRILRRLVPTEEGKVVPRDISKELLKLKKQQVNEFLGNKAPEETRDTQAEASETTGGRQAASGKQSKKRKSKYNLVSNNFRRLKLPKKHGGNRRWQRRR